MITDDPLTELVARIARWALAAKVRIVTAESCTGGWIAKVFTDTPGSSRWFECGYVTYSNEAKMRDLRVPPRTLEQHGAVSEPTVREMAQGALRASGADLSVAVSGVAGPEGGSAEKPVGTVWICVARRISGAADFQLLVEGQRFGGNREAVRRASVQRALELILRFENPL